MESKKWWQSKTVWASIIAGLVAAYNTIGPQFGWPTIPEFVFGILAALGLYSRVVANTTIK